MTIKEIIESEIQQLVTVRGWVRNIRRQKKVEFIDIYDGTNINGIQVVIEQRNTEWLDKGIRIGAAVEVEGVIQIHNQPEIIANSVKVIAGSGEDYPIQAKYHTREFLREISFLRPRTKLFQAIFKIRNEAYIGIHNYFQKEGYLYVSTPLITTNDAEGAGATFSVCSGDGNYFGSNVSLAVTGQLEAEAFALAFGKVYSFGPSFRAEKSNTKNHASEFWMVEPEVAFCDLHQLINIEEHFFKYMAGFILEKCEEELSFLEAYTKTAIKTKLQGATLNNIPRITHKDAVGILNNSKMPFDILPSNDSDFTKEHEDYLLNTYFRSPVFITDWPKKVKAFYMKENDDGSTVSAVDLLVPGAGELMGGSAREVRIDRLIARMDELGISTDHMRWYVDLRKYGCCEHAGFGMGFERFLIWATGINNIRDVIPFPRTYKSCAF